MDCSSIVAGCDTTEVLELVEEALDPMVLLVEVPINWRDSITAGIGIGFDLRACPEVMVMRCAADRHHRRIGNDMADASQTGQASPDLQAVTIFGWMRIDSYR